MRYIPEQVQEACSRYPDIWPVNFNCPGQVTVSGLSSRMPELFADIKAAGGRAVPLKVKGAFHSPFMQAAAADFAEELAKAEIRKGTVTLYSDMTAEPYTENAAELLSGQVCRPVQWEKLIRNMIAEGADTFVEIGPGKTLCGMIRRIDPGVTTYSVTEYLDEVEKC